MPRVTQQESMKTSFAKRFPCVVVTQLAFVTSAVAGDVFREFVALNGKADAARLEDAVYPKEKIDRFYFEFEKLYRSAPVNDRFLMALYVISVANLDGEKASNFRHLIRNDIAEFRNLGNSIDTEKLKAFIELRGGVWNVFRQGVKHFLEIDLPK
jgi:hypothetical protein